eukprot:TRINITY_DN2411_c0_g1_i2.p1 TRINITY_DN2411_c0_g1~~TRINITY_DN2411_c0_g1_i2.p1  ORF type:complete len:219 (-),score=42.47 TRINITY_DN2411_c0_g1_i2:592-1212(-)
MRISKRALLLLVLITFFVQFLITLQSIQHNNSNYPTVSALYQKHEVPAIKRGAVVAVSSEWDPSWGASAAVLYSKEYEEMVGAHAWGPSILDTNQWLQISFHVPKTFVAIETQGRGAWYTEWVTSYVVKYTLNGKDWFLADNGKEFQGNTDRNSIVYHRFSSPFQAYAVRICIILCGVLLDNKLPKVHLILFVPIHHTFSHSIQTS